VGREMEECQMLRSREAIQLRAIDHRLTKTATNKYACNKVDYRWVLQAFNVFLQWLIPKFRVTFIDRVDLATWLYAHVAVN